MGDKWRKLEQVVCSAQSRVDQKPLKFRFRGEWIEVEQVEEVWLETGRDSLDSVFRMYKIKTKLGIHRLRVKLDGWVWEIVL